MLRAVMTAVVCVVAVAAGGGCSAPMDKAGGGHTPRDRTVLIVLSMKPVGGGARQCGYDAPNARAYSKETVTFRIANRCDAAQKVQLDFGNSSPFDDVQPYNVSLGGDAVSEDLKLTVRDHGSIASSVHYDYRILLNGQPGRDPGFEVDPF